MTASRTPVRDAPARPLRALVIGAGPATVDIHLPVMARLRDDGQIVLALVCDIDHERAVAAQQRFGFFESTGDAGGSLERSDIDVVYVFGSAQMHYEHGLSALEHGKHLFVEKPIAPSYMQACVLAQTARANGLIAAAGHNRRFFRSLASVRARAGKARWQFAEAVFHKPEHGKPAPFGARSWLGANGIHALDALVFMMGEVPEQLTALAEGGAQPSSFSALMRWRDGSQAVFLCNNNAGCRREEYAFHGLGETYKVTDEELLVEKPGATERIEIASLGDGYSAEHDAFLHGIATGKEPPHGISAIAPSLFLAQLIEDGFHGRVQLPQLTSSIGKPRTATKEDSILIAQPAGLLPAVSQRLSQYRLVNLEDVRESAGERPDIVAAILGRGSQALTPETLAKLPRLAIVGVVGLSLINHAPEPLLARGVKLANASNAYAESAAEFALGLAILARRRAFLSSEVMRQGGWGSNPRASGIKGLPRRVALGLRPLLRRAGLEQPSMKMWRAAAPIIDDPRRNAGEAHLLQGACVGLIGWGAIAQAFAEHLLRARARVLVYSENAPDADIRASGAIAASLAETLAADIVSLHRGLTDRTRHFLGAAELAKIRSGAILINTARGALIEPAALLDRLRKGDIFACLDTYEEEPLPASDPLRKLTNVFLTAHIAGGSRDMQAGAAEEVVQKVADYLEAGTCELVSAQRLRTMT